MKKKVLFLLAGFLLIGVSLYAAGDLIVDGRLGIGTATPEANLHIKDVSSAGITLDSGDGSTYSLSSLGLYHNGALRWGIFKNSDAAGDLVIGSFNDNGGWRQEVLRVSRSSGNVGFGVSNPLYPIEMASGAYVTTGGVWTDASSREYKENIKEITAEGAKEVLRGLKPVKFNFKADREEGHVGFIAEDVPELVATKDRKGLSPMDIVAVLTKVVQEQQKTISALSEKVNALEQRKN